MSADLKPIDNIRFPWNDAIDMSSWGDSRAMVICLSAVFDAIQALRQDLRDLLEDK